MKKKRTHTKKLSVVKQGFKFHWNYLTHHFWHTGWILNKKHLIMITPVTTFFLLVGSFQKRFFFTLTLCILCDNLLGMIGFTLKTWWCFQVMFWRGIYGEKTYGILTFPWLLQVVVSKHLFIFTPIPWGNKWSKLTNIFFSKKNGLKSPPRKKVYLSFWQVSSIWKMTAFLLGPFKGLVSVVNSVSFRADATSFSLPFSTPLI